MRGCLTFLVFVAVLVGVLGWVALPLAASVAVNAALTAGGVSGTGTSVVVTADPPYELVTLHADEVRISTTDATWGGLRAATLTLDLKSVELGRRTFASIDGELTGATLATTAGTDVTAGRVTITGSSRQAVAVVTIPAVEVRALAAAAAERTIGTAPSAITFSAPDVVTLTVNGSAIAGRLAVDPAGGLVLRVQGVGTVDVLRPAPGLPVHLTGVRIVPGGGVELGGTVDLGSLTG
jgi:hypothetical protein